MMDEIFERDMKIEKLRQELAECKAELAQAVIAEDWVSVDEAPKDGTRFIGLYKGGLVFTTWRQAYNVYKPREDGSSYVDGHRHEWVYDRGDALLGGTPIGWMPLTLKTHHPTED